MTNPKHGNIEFDRIGPKLHNNISNLIYLYLLELDEYVFLLNELLLVLLLVLL